MRNKPWFKLKFDSNILTLITGATLAQAIPISISPILTRLYTPEDFGVFALFTAIVSIFASIATGKYELAIMLPAEEEDALNILAMTVLIAISTSIILLILVLLMEERLVSLLNNEEVGTWLYFVPISVFILGMFNALTYYNNRKKHYRNIAGSKVIRSFFVAIIQVSLGLLKHGAGGLISGQILSNVIANIKLARIITKAQLKSKIFSLRRMLILSKIYRNLPKYSLGTTLANSLSQHASGMLISSFYSINTLGFYSLVQRLLGMPFSLIGVSVSQVFFEEATQEMNETGSVKNVFTKTITKLFLFSLPLFVFLLIFSEDLFGVIFGSEWRLAGIYARILMPLFMLRFVVGTVSIVNVVCDKQRIVMFWQISMLVTSIIVIAFSSIYGLGFKTYLYIYMITSVLHYIILYSMLSKMTKEKR